MRAKPTHVKAIAQLLSEGAASPEELAKLVIGKLDELRSADRTFCVVSEWRRSAGSFYLGYGPYPTRKAAQKAAEGGKAIPEMADVSVVVPMYTPEHLAQTWIDVDTPPTPDGVWAEVAADAEKFKRKKRR